MARDYITTAELAYVYCDILHRAKSTAWWKLKKRYDLFIGLIVIREVISAIEERNFADSHKQNTRYGETNETLN